MKRLIVVMLTVLAVLLAACAPAARNDTAVLREAPPADQVNGGAPPIEVAAAPTQAPAEFGAPVAGVVGEADLQATAAPASDSAPGSTGQLAYAPSGSRLVIKDANLELLVKDPQASLDRVTQLTADVGGYIISSQTWYQDGFMFAQLRLGVPSAEFERTLTTLRKLALQVMREDASGQDVSAEYVDLQSQLTNLEATAARVREFLADAKTVEESLRISGQLSDLEGQIEKAKGQIRFYEGRAAFSTITVQLTPQYPTPTPTLTPTSTATPTATPTLTPTPAWNPGNTFGQASTVLVTMTQGTVDASIWIIIVGGPMIVLGGLFVLVLRRLLRGRSK